MPKRRGIDYTLALLALRGTSCDLFVNCFAAQFVTRIRASQGGGI